MWFVLAVLSAFFNSLGNVARRTHGSLAQPAELAWWSLLLATPLGVGLVLVSNEPLWTSNAYILPALISVLLNSYGSIALFKAYKYGEASAVSPLANLLPIALLVTTFFMTGARPTMAGLGGILLVVAGVYYSSLSSKHALWHPFRQILKNKGSRAMMRWVLVMAFSSALMVIALRHASASYLILFMQAGELLVFSAYLMCRPLKNRVRHGEKVMKKWGWHMAAIAVFGTISVFFQFKAMEMVDVNYVLSVKRLDVLFTVLLAGLFLGEHHIGKRFKGAVLAVIGVGLIYLAS